MPFSFHSHSGDFCKHAHGTLEGMVSQAVALGFDTYGLSEHMPRFQDSNLYPEERDAGLTSQDLKDMFHQFTIKARQLQAQYAGKIKLLVGMETELCRDESLADVQSVRATYNLDYIMGSVHHVNGVPIDYGPALVGEIEDALGGTEKLFIRYFEHMYEMITTLKPDIIGHFDLIRLFRPEFTLTPTILEHIDKAVRAGVEAGCIFEVNSSALRKKLPFPYPMKDVLERIIAAGGRLTLCDDAHRTEQIGLNFRAAREYLLGLGVTSLYYLARDQDTGKVSVVESADWATNPIFERFPTTV